MVVVAIDGVVYEVAPVPPGEITVPALATVYQSMVSPVPGVAEIVTVPVPHRAPLVPVGATGVLFIVAFAVAVTMAQPPDAAMV